MNYVEQRQENWMRNVRRWADESRGEPVAAARTFYPSKHRNPDSVEYMVGILVKDGDVIIGNHSLLFLNTGANHLQIMSRKGQIVSRKIDANIPINHGTNYTFRENVIPLLPRDMRKPAADYLNSLNSPERTV